jgi:asparagine synthase (glutamine-hydrolysing)
MNESHSTRTQTNSLRYETIMLDATDEHWKASPYIHLRRVDGEVKLRGTTAHFEGNDTDSDSYTENPGRGVFAFWCWSGNRLLVRNDRYGFYPLFYFVRRDEIAVSTSILKLLALGASSDFDNAGLAVFLRTGSFVGERTAFKEIRAFPPNAVAEWEGGRWTLSGGPRLPQLQELTFDQAVDGYISLFRAAIAKRVRSGERVAVPLSGGRDSRHILLELCHAGHRPNFCMTVEVHPPRSNADVGIAKILAAAVNIEHFVVRQPHSQLKQELHKNTITEFLAEHPAWALAIEAFVRNKADVSYHGIAGDGLSGGNFMTPELLKYYELGMTAACAQHHLDVHNNEIVLERCLEPNAYQTFNRQLALANIYEQVKVTEGTPSPSALHYFWTRSRRNMSLMPFRILNRSIEIRAPYLDYDLYDFLASLPASFQMENDLHTGVIQRAYPEYKDIPYASGGLSTSGRNYRIHILNVLKYLMFKRSKLVNRSWLFSVLLSAIVRNDFRFVIELNIRRIICLVQLENFVDNKAWADASVFEEMETVQSLYGSPQHQSVASFLNQVRSRLAKWT